VSRWYKKRTHRITVVLLDARSAESWVSCRDLVTVRAIQDTKRASRRTCRLHPSDASSGDRLVRHVVLMSCHCGTSVHRLLIKVRSQLIESSCGENILRYRGGVTVTTLDSWSRGCGFNSRSGRYQVVTTWMGDCLRTGKPSRYITNTKDNSAFHPSVLGKSSTGLSGWGSSGARSPV